MEALLALVVGALFATSLYALLRRSLLRLVIGLALLNHAVHLLIFTVAGPVRGRPPVIPATAERLAPPFADPLPQALILTAIVIGFGVQAFALVLVQRTYEAVGTDDVDALPASDR